MFPIEYVEQHSYLQMFEMFCLFADFVVVGRFDGWVNSSRVFNAPICLYQF